MKARLLRRKGSILPARARQQSISGKYIDQIDEAMKKITIAPYSEVHKSLADATSKTIRIAGCRGIVR